MFNREIILRWALFDVQLFCFGLSDFTQSAQKL